MWFTHLSYFFQTFFIHTSHIAEVRFEVWKSVILMWFTFVIKNHMCNHISYTLLSHIFRTFYHTLLKCDMKCDFCVILVWFTLLREKSLVWSHIFHTSFTHFSHFIPHIAEVWFEAWFLCDFCVIFVWF